MSTTRRLNRRDITLFTISAILTIDGLAAAAAIGVQSLTWWLLCFLCFAIPYALISIELGTRWPSQGGITSWVRLAFGSRWSARTSWFYWINVALWMPAAFIMMAGIFSRMFWPDMSIYMQIVFALAATWVVVAINCLSIETGKWIPNIGACCKIFIVLSLGLGGVVTAYNNGMANVINFETLMPTWDSGLRFFPVIIFSMVGFDLVCCAGDEIDEPEKNLPIALMIACAVITILYFFAVFGMLVAVPANEIGLVDGLIDTFDRLLEPLPGSNILLIIVACLIMFTLVTNLVTWSMGANRAALDAARDNELPKAFGILHSRNNTPVGASILSGLVSSCAILLYGFMANSADGLYWSLFSFANLIFLLPYLLMFPAYLVLQKKFQGEKPGWQVPGGKWSKKLLAILPLLFTAQAVVFFIIPPGSFDLKHTLITLFGLFVVAGIGEWITTPTTSREKLSECPVR